MNCPLCKGEMAQIQPTLWGCKPCDSLWTPDRLSDHILWLDAARQGMRESHAAMLALLEIKDAKIKTLLHRVNEMEREKAYP